MRTFFAFTLAAFAAFCGPVAAADVYGSSKDTPAHVLPTQASTQSWTSIWIAALAGYSMSNTQYDLDARQSDKGEGPGSWENVASLDGIGGEGFDGTFQLGADYQLGQALLGIFGEYSFGGTSTDASIGAAKLEIDQMDSYGLFARAGFISGETLFYGAGGYVWTEADVSVTGLKTRTFDFSGPALEGGVEHRFSPNIRGRLSARYTWLESEAFTNLGDCVDTRLTSEPGIWSVKAGIVLSTGGLLGALER